MGKIRKMLRVKMNSENSCLLSISTESADLIEKRLNDHQ